MIQLTLRKGVTLLALFVMAAGCASSGERLADESGPIDIRWLTDRLQDKGVFVTERGAPNPLIMAKESSRLVLDRMEVLDVFSFSQSDRARTTAREFAGLNPGNDVFVKESIVVVRYSRRDSGLSQVLYELLGAAI